MARQSPSSRPRRWLLPVLVTVVAGLLIAFVVVRAGSDGGEVDVGPQAGQAATQTAEGEQDLPDEVIEVEEPDLSELERRDADDLLTAGPLDAPVAIVVYSDYQCPFCASWNHETFPELAGYIEAGDLRVEWRDVNIFGEESERASRAAYAAALQDSYWVYHDELFAGGDIRSPRALGEEPLVEIAADLGLDTDQFAADMDAEETRDEVRANAQEGIDIGAHSTPTFIVDGEAILGAQPTDVFIDAIETALQAAGG